MPTNDERREVAARLREHQHGDVRCPTLEGGMVASWWRLKDALCAEGSDPQEDHTMMFGYLADLIEPERTCRMEYNERKRSVYCSNCGKRMDMYTCDQYGDGTIGYSYPFCCECGAKVVEEA